MPRKNYTPAERALQIIGALAGKTCAEPAIWLCSPTFDKGASMSYDLSRPHHIW